MILSEKRIGRLEYFLCMLLVNVLLVVLNIFAKINADLSFGAVLLIVYFLALVSMSFLIKYRCNDLGYVAIFPVCILWIYTASKIFLELNGIDTAKGISSLSDFMKNIAMLNVTLCLVLFIYNLQFLFKKGKKEEEI